jgi:iron(III) transport system ATP-binding protein
VLGALPFRNSSLEGAVQVMVRPEQIRLSRRGPNGQRAEGAAAAVVGHTYQGADTIVRALLADEARTPVSARTFDLEVPAAGELVDVAVSGPVIVYPPPGSPA